MDFLKLGLDVAQKEFRRNVLGGSDANVIMSGNEEAIHRLWQIKRGVADAEDLSDVLPVMMGLVTENFNLFWFEKQTGYYVTDHQQELLSIDHPFMAATLDGVVRENSVALAIIDAKHVNAFAKKEETLAKYMPQLHHNMILRGLDRAVLSVFYGTLEWKAHWVDYDPIYGASLLEAEYDFWDCVKSGRPPVAAPVIAPPLPAVRKTDMQGNNFWADQATSWLDTYEPAKKHETAAKSIKEMIEADVKEAYGHGIIVKRAENNSLRISKLKVAK